LTNRLRVSLSVGGEVFMWEIFFCDNGRTVEWSTAEAEDFFGKAEFEEIKQGYLPHIVAVWVDPVYA